jgi:hypothetical protein
MDGVAEPDLTLQPLGKVVTGRDGKGALHVCRAAAGCSQLPLRDGPILVDERAGEGRGFRGAIPAERS